MVKILAAIAFALALAPAVGESAVNLNTASKDELLAVPGIGPAKAQAIVEHRQTHGPFKSVDDLKSVKGFRAKLIEKLRPELTVSAPVPRSAARREAKSAPERKDAKAAPDTVRADAGRIQEDKSRK